MEDIAAAIVFGVLAWQMQCTTKEEMDAAKATHPNLVPFVCALMFVAWVAAGLKVLL